MDHLSFSKRVFWGLLILLSYFPILGLAKEKVYFFNQKNVEIKGVLHGKPFGAVKLWSLTPSHPIQLISKESPSTRSIRHVKKIGVLITEEQQKIADQFNHQSVRIKGELEEEFDVHGEKPEFPVSLLVNEIQK